MLSIIGVLVQTQAKIDEIDDANVTPGDFSVMVRGLPADVTKEEVCSLCTCTHCRCVFVFCWCLSFEKHSRNVPSTLNASGTNLTSSLVS